ncbi:hypothetical protein [Lampropedia aestuarii]|uniref:hypothetical protein n=1 Tax=Lampropedia aestuarii TaxID=2562762 RepID=UPI002468B4F9|nr:hypothetical protein [Lampropedia aestuarii]MDH5859279.1 hypothetical protein [Lampropedia aestuarii]
MNQLQLSSMSVVLAGTAQVVIAQAVTESTDSVSQLAIVGKKLFMNNWTSQSVIA